VIDLNSPEWGRPGTQPAQSRARHVVQIELMVMSLSFQRTYGLKGDGETGPTYGTGAPDYQ